MGLGSRVEGLVEALYAYRLSWGYELHLAVVVCLGLLILYLFVREWSVRRRAYIYAARKGREVKTSSEFAEETDHHTAEEVRKLRESE
jgi:hypothetical protein